MHSPTCRAIVASAVASLSLVGATAADAHSVSPRKAARSLATTIRSAHSRTVSTGKVSVTGCKATGRSRGHRHQFACRVAVDLVYANGSVKHCTDRSVSVRIGDRHHRPGSFYLNAAHYHCATVAPVEGSPSSGQTDPSPSSGSDVTPVPSPSSGAASVPDESDPSPIEEPPSTAAPTGPPPSLPPFFPDAVDGGASSATVTGHKTGARSGVKAHTSQAVNGYTWRGWHPWFKWNGYYFAWAEWQYTSLNCNLYDDYFALYYWDGSQPVYAGAQWYRHAIYGYGDYDWTQSPIC